MPSNVPASVWRITSGQGELGTTSGNLVTLSGDQLVTLDDYDLVVLGGTVIPTPATEWDIVEEVPDTAWRTQDGMSEFSNGGVYDIADPSGDLLVDPSGDQIVDTGVNQFTTPATEWEENNSV